MTSEKILIRLELLVISEVIKLQTLFNNMKKISSILLFASTLILLSSCADYHLRQGNRLFNQWAYSEAIPEYEKAQSKKPSAQAAIGIAESYRQMNNTVKAEDAYAKVVAMNDAKAIHKFHYAQVLMINGKHSAAKPWLEAYLKENPNDKAAQDLLASCDKVEDLKKDSARYSVELSKINSGQSNFSPTVYKDGIVFATDRTGLNTRARVLPLLRKLIRGQANRFSICILPREIIRVDGAFLNL